MAYLINLATLCAIFAMLAMSLNLVAGYTGLLSIAHAGFFGIGAYTTALLMINFNLNFFIAAIVGMILAGLAAFLVGSVMSKFRGDYYALASLGFVYIIYSIFDNWESLTLGALGLPGIARPTFFGISLSGNGVFLSLCIIFVALIYFLTKKLTDAPFGRVLKAIREDESAIAVFGYHVRNYKLTAFVISAAIAAFAGSFYASYIHFIAQSSFNVSVSVFALACVIIGGLASLRGSIIGAVLLIALLEALRFVGFPTEVAAQLRDVGYGLALVLLMLYRPQGIIGEYKL